MTVDTAIIEAKRPQDIPDFDSCCFMACTKWRR